MKAPMSWIAAITLLASTAAGGTKNDLSDTYKTVAAAVCKHSLQERQKLKEYKSLKLAGSKLEPICTLTARTAVTECMEKNDELLKPYLSSPDVGRLSALMKGAVNFCGAYADISSLQIIDLVLKDATAHKISVDEAVANVVRAAQK